MSGCQFLSLIPAYAIVPETLQQYTILVTLKEQWFFLIFLFDPFDSKKDIINNTKKSSLIIIII